MDSLFPELKRIEDEAVRGEVYREASRALVAKPTYWLALLGVPIGASILGVLGLQVLQRYVNISNVVGTAVIGGVIGGTFTGSAQFLFRKPMQRKIRELLNERGIEICVHCGYDLRGNPDDTCSECGRATSPIAD